MDFDRLVACLRCSKPVEPEFVPGNVSSEERWEDWSAHYGQWTEDVRTVGREFFSPIDFARFELACEAL